MCLAVPMQITHIDGDNAHCVAKGIERDVSLLLLEDDDIKLGDHVLIHVGYALQKISADEAISSWELLDQMSAEDDLLA
jgi:hydrogenase expression/formation protein HypC